MKFYLKRTHISPFQKQGMSLGRQSRKEVVSCSDDSQTTPGSRGGLQGVAMEFLRLENLVTSRCCCCSESTPREPVLGAVHYDWHRLCHLYLLCSFIAGSH